MESLQSLINHLLATHDNWKLQLLHHWPSILGPLSNKVHLEKIAEDHLVLGVTDSCWLQELYLMSPLLKQTINKKLDRARIKTLRFKIGAKKPVEKPMKAIKKRPAVRKQSVLSSQEQQALTRIQDEELKQALAQFLQRCKQEYL